MYGWRGKIGHIAPSRGDIFVYEFYKMAPEGVVMFNSTGTIRQLDRNNIERQLARVEEAAIDLAENDLDLIIIGGSPLFTSQGVGSDISAARRVQEKVKTAVTTGVTAEVEAMRAMGMKKVVVVTPHQPAMDAMMKDFLEGSGFQVVAIGGMGCLRNAEISKLPDHASYRLAKKLFFEAPEKADGVFIHCPRWPTIGCIELLEKELGCPVITSSQSYTWWSLKLTNIRQNIPGYGQLMQSLG